MNQRKKLFIIGNGFDRWQGLPTSYDEFKKYYYENAAAITRKLKIKTEIAANGALITPVEMIYGDVFKPNKLSNEFFWSFETSLSFLDDQKLNLYFGKTKRGLYELQETIKKAQQILQYAFSKWIQSIDITKLIPKYDFGNDCYFVNFNYTDTLQKRFGVNADDIYYIHGEAEDAESIVFGHSTHPEMPFAELMEQKFIKSIGGGKARRLQGLYLVESALYETDKHVQDNIDDLCEFMTLDGIHIEDFEDIYVLGLSFSEPDYEYIDFLVKATKAGVDYNVLSALWQVHQIGLENIGEDDLLDGIQLNVAYAANRRKRVLGVDNIAFPKEEMIERALFGRVNVYTDGDGMVHDASEAEEKAKDAVHKRFIFEQAQRTKEVIEDLCLLKGVEYLPSDCLSILKAADYIDGGHGKRVKDAKWHISYFSEKDKNRIESVMNDTGCRNYELYPSIDACISKFKAV